MPVNDSFSSPSQAPLNRSLFYILIVLTFLLVGGSIYFLSKQNKNPFTQGPQPDKIIMRVGEESLYQKDLTWELDNQIAEKNDKLKQIMRQKLINDSITLQAAASQSLITLDPTVYNASKKDYTKRLALIKEVKDKIEKNSAPLSGELVTLYFYNGTIGPLGYDKAKATAFEKISSLQKKVKAGAISMYQAGEAIRNDPTNIQLDKQYIKNSYAKFSVARGEKLNSSDEFTAALSKLDKSEVSDVFAIKDPVASKDGKATMVETYYQFAKISDQGNSSNYADYNQWFAQLKDKYAVISY